MLVPIWNVKCYIKNVNFTNTVTNCYTAILSSQNVIDLPEGAGVKLNQTNVAAIINKVVSKP